MDNGNTSKSELDGDNIDTKEWQNNALEHDSRSIGSKTVSASEAPDQAPITDPSAKTESDPFLPPNFDQPSPQPTLSEPEQSFDDSLIKTEKTLSKSAVEEVEKIFKHFHKTGSPESLYRDYEKAVAANLKHSYNRTLGEDA